MQREEEVVYLHLDDIIPNRFQPREVFEERPLKELAVSIKEHGVIQPIIVRKIEDKYEIIAGERRYKASALAGLTKIPAIIRDLDDKESSKVALLENLQRKNLNPLEEARTYQKILELDEMTQEELAKTMGKSQSAVSNKLRLLSLPDDVQDALLKEKISERHARSLLNLKSSQEQTELMKRIVNNKMTVRQVEEEIKTRINSEKEVVDEVRNTEEKLTISDVPTAESFIPENPLMPSLDGENDDLNTPILTNISTFSDKVGEEENEQPKFINFGDIKNDNNDTEELLFDNQEKQEIDYDDIKENASDINSTIKSNNHDLDSLLNLNSRSSKNDNNNEFKFFSPAREALKEVENDKKENKEEDYFKAPDLINIELPTEIQTDNINSMKLDGPTLIEHAEEKEDNMKKAIDLIRNCIDEINDLGLKIEKDEISLEKSYQVVIKIEKEK